MLVRTCRLPRTLALVLAASVAWPLASTVAAAEPARPGERAGWTQATLDAGKMTRDEADRAFAAPPADPKPAAGARVDESALRYYAAQHATARVDAEIRRLRALYPGWEPPADLYRPAADEQGLWDLYGKDQVAELKLEIERRAARQPGWRPSQDMLDKLHRKEQRLELLKASDSADWTKVQKMVERDPMLVSADDLEVVWRVAEAAAKTDARPRALELYRMALAGAKTPDERAGTVRKALAAMGAEAAGPLFAEERIGPDGKGEFEPLRVDVARATLSDWLRADAGKPVPKDAFDRVSRVAETDAGSADDAVLLGWVEHRRKAAAPAQRWFDLAAKRGGGAKAAIGAALVREGSGRHAEAVALLEAATDDAEAAALFLDLASADLVRPNAGTIPAARLARIAAVTEKLESGDAAQALGWYAHGARQYEAASAWFAKAMAWRPSAKSAEGHLLALAALKNRDAFRRLDADYRGRFPDMARVVFDEPRKVAAAPRVAAAPAAPKRSCPALVADRVLGRSGTAAEALAAGWCLMDLKRAEEAAAAFDAARRGGDATVMQEAAYGQALAALRSGRTDDAARVAASGGLARERRDEIGRIVLAQQAIALFDRGDYRATIDTLNRRRAHADEPRDLMAMRGWSLYHLGLRAEAFEVFTLLDRQLSTSESRAGLAAASSPVRGGRI